MAAFVLWRALLQPATAPPSASSSVPSSVPSSTPVYAALRPLLGGPSFLPLHVQIAHEGTLYDFLPSNPLAPVTTASLLTGQAVEGSIRCRPVRSVGRDPTWRRIGYTARTSNDLLAFAEQQERSLSLTDNNWCAHFRLFETVSFCPTDMRRVWSCTQLDVCEQACALCYRRIAPAPRRGSPSRSTLVRRGSRFVQSQIFLIEYKASSHTDSACALTDTHCVRVI